MEESGQEQKPGVVVTSLGFREEMPVSEHFSKTREQIRERLKTTFESLPEVGRGPFKMQKFMQKNPQAVIFVPEKDINMFSPIVEEAKAFANQFILKGDVEKDLKQIREHEFEHLQKAYELGLNIKGIGLVMMKYKGKPFFGGFVTCSEKEEISLRDNLRLRLAPKTLAFRNIGDMLSSELLVIRDLIKAKSWEERDQIFSDTFFVISERYLPKKIHNFLQGIDGDKK